MGGASKLLSSLLLTSSTSSRLRSSAAAFSFFFSPSSTSRRRNHHLLLSSPSPLRTLSTTTSSSSLPCNPSPAPSPPAPSPEWSRLVDRLAAAGYASRPRSPADELALASGCGLSAEAEAAVSSCLAFARDRPELLRSLPRKDVEIVVANAAPVLFKDAEGSARRLQRYLAREESNVYQSERAETVDIVRYLLSYACSASDNYSKDKEVTDSAVRNILDDLISFSGLAQSSRFLESTPKLSPLSQHERFSRPPGQNIEMKRGDWICTRCSFMNFARNVRCLECNEQRPKKMLTGGEWECPQCEFYNYGRNMSCLRCDCKRPGTIPQNPASAGAGLGGVVQLLNGTSAGNSEIEGKLAENDEKAERWLSKVSQLDDSTDLSSLAADEDFPEIMPMRKGVNKFVVSTHKTPLERRLANAQYSSNHNPQANTSSDSKVSQTLDRILGRSTSTPGTTNQSATGAANGGARKNLTDLLGEIDPVPFVPLPADMFAKPQNANSNATTNKDSEMITKADNSMMNNSMASTESQDERRSSDTAEKWCKKASELNNVKGSLSAISDEEFPEIMPMRKGENRFVISKKKDRSLTSPQYKRRVLEHASNSNFVPFVPFPPGYFAKKDKLTEATPAAGVVSEGSPSPETMPPPKASAESFRTSSNASQVMDNQSNNNLNNGNWNRNYSQQNLESEGGYSYGESRDHARQLPSYGVGNQSSSSLNAGAWNNNYSQGNFNESRGGSTYNGNNYSAEQPYTSGYTNSNNAWNSDSNNGWSGSYSYNKSPSSYSASSNPNQPGSSSNSGDNWNRGYTGKSLEGSAVKEPDPLDMSEEAKAERWFRRAAQIKDISELANIPDEDFPEIMPMRKGVNRFVVSKRKTPLERRLTSPQYRRNLPTINSEPDKDVSENRNG